MKTGKNISEKVLNTVWSSEVMIVNERTNDLELWVYDKIIYVIDDDVKNKTVRQIGDRVYGTIFLKLNVI